MFKKENSVAINIIGDGGNNKITGNKIFGYDKPIKVEGDKSNNEISDNYIEAAIDSQISTVIDSLSLIPDRTLNPGTGELYRDEIIAILKGIQSNNKKSAAEKANVALSLFNNWTIAQPKITALVEGVVNIIKNLPI